MPKPQALQVEPRVAPTGRSIRLFAIASPELAGRRFTVEGRRLQCVRFGKLSLAIAYVDPAEYAPPALERRCSDVPWMTIEARLHERAIERAGAHAELVLPAPLFAIYPDTEALEARAREQSERWLRALTRFAGKREFALHVYLGPHYPPGGEPYALRVTARTSRGGRFALPKKDETVLASVRGIWQACSSLSTAMRRLNPSARRGELFSAALLVPEFGVAALHETLRTLSLEATTLGLTCYLEGPRPPFSFASS